tara:strand:- start:513 stop:728 length:216 start_codon:yes stop_codon:yes gene_type:complete
MRRTKISDLPARLKSRSAGISRSRGLGDTVEKFTKATGIKKVVDYVAEKTNKDCGCNKRRDTLNRMFPYDK